MRHLNKSIKQRLLSGGAWAFMAKAGTGILTIALTALITRLLNPVDVGVLFLSFSIIMMVSQVMRLGLDQLAIKLVGEALSGKKYQQAMNVAIKVFKLVTLLCIISAGFIYFTFDTLSPYFFSKKEPSDVFKLFFALWVLIATLQLLFAEIFRAYHFINYASIFSGGTLFGGFSVSVCVGIGLLSLIFLDIPITMDLLLAIILITTGSFLFIELLILVGVFKSSLASTDNSGGVPTEISFGELIRKGFPFFISVLCLYALIHMDTVILGLYRPEDEVALYATTTRIVKILVLTLIVAYEVVAPIIVELNAKNQRQHLEKILRVTATIAAIPSSILLFIFIFKSELVLGVLFGEYYKEGAALLIILSIGQLINAWTGLCSYTLNMLGYQKVNMYIYSVVTILALLFCFLFAEKYGAIGVAWIISVAWVSQNLAALIATKYLTGIWTHANIVLALKELGKLMKNR